MALATTISGQSQPPTATDTILAGLSAGFALRWGPVLTWADWSLKRSPMGPGRRTAALASPRMLDQVRTVMR